MPPSVNPTPPKNQPVVRCCGDDLLSVDVVGPEDGQALAHQLRESGDWLECVAGIDSVVVQFDAMTMNSDAARQKVLAALAAPLSRSTSADELLEVPVCYGGEHGPDFDRVCAQLQLAPDELVKRHAGHDYRVDMLGFTPGFAYIGGLDDSLNVPRLRQPRQHVAAGSVGIADGRSGIYSLPGPGGWPIIGRTPLSLFDASADQPFLLQAGRRIRFVAVDSKEISA